MRRRTPSATFLETKILVFSEVQLCSRRHCSNTSFEAVDDVPP